MVNFQITKLFLKQQPLQVLTRITTKVQALQVPQQIPLFLSIG